MFALLVVAHPSSESFTHALAASASAVLQKRGYLVVNHDLYREQFDPVQRTGELQNTVSTDALIERYCSDLARADLILLFHPNWWGQPPAILKGWVDRVFRLNTAYGYAPGTPPEGVPIGLLKARQAFVFNTSNTPVEREQEVFGDPLDLIWKKCVFPLCGVSTVTRRMYGPISGSTPGMRERWLAEVAALVEDAA
ncbi:MAG: NAD(P)H-dependent oxidoreductase [Povalibacter sp.]